MTTARRMLAFAVTFALIACVAAPVPQDARAASSSSPARRRSVAPAAPLDTRILDDVEHRTFGWFWDLADPTTSLVPDRWPTKSFCSIAAVGFALNAYGIGAERGWVTREQAADRTLETLRFFLDAPMGPEAVGKSGYKGFYYHFLEMESGVRFKDVELSTIDSALLFAGMLFSQSYFDRDDPTEKAIRETAEEIYRRADWTFFLERPPLVSMGWKPEDQSSHGWDWRGYNEAMILYVLALGSPTHPVDPKAWDEYTSTYHWDTFYGQEHVTFGPMFGHQFSHVWIDFKGIQDAYMRGKGIDYAENTRRAAYSQRQYAIENPMGWRGYGENVWGLSACDGPFDGFLEVNGARREFWTYAARAISPREHRDDGTITPMAAISSMPFAPEIAIPAMNEMYERFGGHLYQQYGFLDAFNPTITFQYPVKMGQVVPGVGWFDGDYLGIDQGPLLAMIENHRTGLIWKTMKKNPHIIRGLQRAGFEGGWLGGQ